MTVSTTAVKITYNGNGATTVFGFTFPGVAAADLVIYYTDADGNISVLSPSTYTILLNAATGSNPTGVGGSVTYPLVGSPIALGTKLTILRSLSPIQGTSLANQVTLYQQAIELALDYQTMVGQGIIELLGRQFTVPVSDPNPAELPNATQRANKFAYFDADGNMVAGSTISNTTVSAPTIPVVSAVSLAAARTAMGLGAIATEGIGTGLQDDGAGNVRRNSLPTAVATNQAPTSTAHLKRYIATGPITFTLPRANTTFSGFGFWVEAYTGAVTLTRNAADSFVNTALSSIIIPIGASAFITTDGAASGVWYIEYYGSNYAPSASGSVSGLTIVPNAVTPFSKIDVTFGECAIPDVNGGGSCAYGIFQSFTIDATTVGVNGLDTGALAANTWYFVFVIANHLGQIGGLLSTQANLPVLPLNYKFLKRLGAVRCDVAVHLGYTIQRGNQVQYKSGLFQTLASGLSALTLFATAAMVPVSASAVHGILRFTGTNPSSASVYASSSGGPIPITEVGTTSAGNLTTCMHFRAMLENDGLYYACTGAGLVGSTLAITGWEENINA